MPVTDTIDVAVQSALNRVANGMLRAMVFFQTTHMQKLNVPNTGVSVKRKHDTRQIIGMSIVTGFKKGSTYTIYPNPSKPGEYPRKITGQGQAGVVYGPTTAEAIIDNGMVAHIGHLAFLAGQTFGQGGRKTAQGTHAPGLPYNYIVGLEKDHDRLGYAKTAELTRDQVAALVMQRA